MSTTTYKPPNHPLCGDLGNGYLQAIYYIITIPDGGAELFSIQFLHLKCISDPLKPLASFQTFSNLKLHYLQLKFKCRFCLHCIKFILSFRLIYLWSPTEGAIQATLRRRFCSIYVCALQLYFWANLQIIAHFIIQVDLILLR